MPDPIPNSNGTGASAQGTSAVTAAAAQASAQGGTGPWASKIESQFSDPAVRAQVDAFLRSEIQPYVTGLEQQSSQFKDEAKLFQDFKAAPAETYLQITSELFGDDAVDRVIELLTDEPTQPDEDTTPPPVTETQRDPEMQAMYEEWQAQKRREAYNTELERVLALPDNKDVKANLLHPFVVAAEGDFDRAVEGYKQHFSVETPAAEDAPETPPNALGSDTNTSTTPPTQQHFNSVDDALDSFFDDLKQSAPPVVGGV